MIVYLVEASFGSYEDYYRQKISLRTSEVEAEKDKAWFHALMQNEAECPISKEKLDLYFLDEYELTEKEAELYNKWQDYDHREYNACYITPIELDERLYNVQTLRFST